MLVLLFMEAWHDGSNVPQNPLHLFHVSACLKGQTMAFFFFWGGGKTRKELIGWSVSDSHQSHCEFAVVLVAAVVLIPSEQLVMAAN